LRSNAVFRRFMVARAVSWAGSAVTLVALPMLLYQRTGSPALTALLTTFEALPYLVFGLLAGALADRWSRRRIMVVTSVVEALVLASVPVASVLGVLSTPQLLVVAVLTATMAVFFDAASFGALPTMVPRSQLPAAQSASTAVSTVISLAGPAVGGGLAAVTGAAEAMTVNAITFAVAAVLLGRLPLASIRSTSARRSTIRADIAEGLRFIARHQLVRSLTLLGVGNSITSGAVLGLLVVVCVERVGLPSDSSQIGLFYAVSGLGALAATALLPVLVRRLPVGWTTLLGLGANWILLVAWSSSASVLPALVVLGLWQLTNSLVIINGITVRMQVTPDALQGRVNTTARMVAWGGQPAGAALGGVLAEAFGVRTALLVMGCGVLASFVAGLATPLRHRSLAVELPEPAAA
jgi:predicted MFS family arabinose efflux permease